MNTTITKPAVRKSKRGGKKTEAVLLRTRPEMMAAIKALATADDWDQPDAVCLPEELAIPLGIDGLPSDLDHAYVGGDYQTDTSVINTLLVLGLAAVYKEAVKGKDEWWRLAEEQRILMAWLALNPDADEVPPDAFEPDSPSGQMVARHLAGSPTSLSRDSIEGSLSLAGGLARGYRKALPVIHKAIESALDN